MVQSLDEKRLSLICLRWLGFNALAVVAYLPFGWYESGYGFSALPLFVVAAQAYYLRRDCPWWIWAPVSFFGCASSLLFLMFWGLAFGCTMSLAQAACLAPRSVRAALAWAILGALGWIVAAAIFFGSDLGAHSWAIHWSIAFGTQSFFFLPAVIMLDKAALARASKQSNESPSGSGV